jgi:hypothetical protein
MQYTETHQRLGGGNSAYGTPRQREGNEVVAANRALWLRPRSACDALVDWRRCDCKLHHRKPFRFHPLSLAGTGGVLPLATPQHMRRAEEREKKKIAGRQAVIGVRRGELEMRDGLNSTQRRASTTFHPRRVEADRDELGWAGASRQRRSADRFDRAASGQR